MVRSTVWLGVIFVINETLLSVPTMYNYHPPTGRHQRRNNVDIEIRDKRRERSDLAACRTPTVPQAALQQQLHCAVHSYRFHWQQPGQAVLPAALVHITGTRTGTGPALPPPVGVQNDLPPRATSDGSNSRVQPERRHEPRFYFHYSPITATYSQIPVVLWKEISIVKKQSPWSRLPPPPRNSLAVLFWSVLLNANAADYVLWS